MQLAEMATSLASYCPGCPAARYSLLPQLVGSGSNECKMRSLTLEAREPLPAEWSTRYSLALVRRGFMLRQRLDGQGRATAVDAVGPGNAFPLSERVEAAEGGPRTSGFAVTRALVCVTPLAPVREALRSGGTDACDLHMLNQDVGYRMERLSDARGRTTAIAQVAALLCALADTLVRKPPVPNCVPAGFLQRDLAALLSIRPESFCRALRQLQKRQLIRDEEHGTLLLDRAQLEAL